MTLREMNRYIDAQGWVRFDDLNVRVIVQDVRVSYGTVQLCVTPVKGSGEKWVTTQRFIEEL
jgi:hypothetical protein